MLLGDPVLDIIENSEQELIIDEDFVLKSFIFGNLETREKKNAVNENNDVVITDSSRSEKYGTKEYCENEEITFVNKKKSIDDSFCSSDEEEKKFKNKKYDDEEEEYDDYEYSEDEIDSIQAHLMQSISFNTLMDRKKKRSNETRIFPNPERFDKITGEYTEEFLKVFKNTFASKKIVMNRERIENNLLENAHELDQFIIESFVYTNIAYKLALKWIIVHNDCNIEYAIEIDNKNADTHEKSPVIIKRFTCKTTENDMPEWKLYCNMDQIYKGQSEKEMEEEENKNKKISWFDSENCYLCEDRICIAGILDTVIITPYIKLMEGLQIKK